MTPPGPHSNAGKKSAGPKSRGPGPKSPPKSHSKPPHSKSPSKAGKADLPGGKNKREPEKKREKFLHLAIRVVHEDESFIIVDKPSGVLTAGLPGHDRESVFNEVKQYIRNNAKRRGTRVWIIHRLDKEASGLLVFAKTESAFDTIKQEFRAKRVHRLYAAVLEGEIKDTRQAGTDAGVSSDAGTESSKSEKSGGGIRAGRAAFMQPLSGTVQSFLYEDERGIVHSSSTPSAVPRGASRRSEDEDDGVPRLAVTHWQVQQIGAGRTLVQARLETGRKNQIRVHMKQLGHCIVGDRRYGASTDPLGRLCLHAFELGFAHPATGEMMRFRSPTPGSFFSLVGRKPTESAGVHGAPTPSAPAAPTPKPATTPAVPVATPAVAAPATSEHAQTPATTTSQQPIEAPAPAAATPVTLPTTPAAQTPSAASLPRPEMFVIEPTRAPQQPKRDVEAPTKPAPVANPTANPAVSASTPSSWNHVAEWYDQLLEDRGSDHHEQVILPGALRLLGVSPGMRVLDVACGQGILARRLASLGASVVGVDAAPRLIEAADRLNQQAPPGVTLPEFRVGDARALNSVVSGVFDRAACIMALMNIEPLSPVFSAVNSLLAPGGEFVCVMLHPAFRAPGQTSWGWDRAASSDARNDYRPASRSQGPRREPPASQYRRVDGYLSNGQKEIVMNPGAAAHGAKPITTITYHRPIQAYIKAICDAGLTVSALEEWASIRTSEPGPRAAEENRARREIPMFLAIRARRTQ